MWGPALIKEYKTMDAKLFMKANTYLKSAIESINLKKLKIL